MKDYSSIEQKLNALMEELQSLKEADDETEEVAEIETTEAGTDDAVTINDDVSVEETTEDSIDEYAKEAINGLGGSILKTFMDCLNDISLLSEQVSDEKIKSVIDEVKENTNKAIGALQAVISVDNSDSEAQEEAREEAEAKIAGDDVVETEEKSEEEVEVIKPIEDGEESETEETVEEETEEKKEESLETSGDKKLDEDLQVIMSFSDYKPWSGAEETYNYIMEQYGWDASAVESVLEEVFPDGCTDTELNDFFWFDDNIYEIFGVKDPYAEDDNEEEEDVEEVDEEDVEVEESINGDDISAEEIDDDLYGDIDEEVSVRARHRK